jgi:hypothetical protein
MLAVMSIAGIVMYTSLGRTSNDSGRVALRSTKLPLKNSAASDDGPPITLFDNYEICPAYFEDRTDYACGDTTCYAGQSCQQSDGSTEYVLVSSPGDYCASVGLEAITTPEECAAAGTVLNGSVLPGVNRTFQTCNEGASCPDLTDYQAGNPCWITGTSGSLKFSDLYLNGTAGVTCGTVDPYDSWSSPSACICKQTQNTSSSCENPACQQPENMTEFFTQVLIQHYHLDNVDNLQVSDADEFTYQFEGQNFVGSRSDILHCDGQTGRLAVNRPCECANGLPSALFCGVGAQACELCSSGFTLINGTCVANTCTCANGIAATGADCPVDGAEICTGCDVGFGLDSNACFLNQCSCQNGAGTYGTECDPSVNNGADCKSCNGGYDLTYKANFDNVYYCVYDGGDDTCHPSDATVVVQHACDTGLCLAQRRMDELNIGDTVESEVGIFEPVLAFLHRDGDAKGEFFSFEFVNNSMEISGNHYMYANGKRVLPGTVNIGDVLSNGETIKDIKQVSKAGLFHPITLSTKLMVNGVQVSTNFEWGGIDVSYIENIFGWVAKALYTIGMPIDVAEDTLWAPLMTVRDNWSSVSHRMFTLLPRALHPVGIVLGGLLLLGYVYPQTALFALITMATVKKNKLI